MDSNSFIQGDFSGGMNLFTDDTSIADNEYVVGFNIRNRTSCLKSIPDAEKDTTVPAGNLNQGLYAFDKYLVLFRDGLAYYKNIEQDLAWTQITGFSMAPLLTKIYAEAVPQSTLNYQRKLTTTDKINGTQLNTQMDIPNLTINGSLGGLIVQDTINQPYIIFSDGTCRQLQTYLQWSPDATYGREYVPIMKQMKYHNGILFGVASTDPTVIYRSVSGRPTDFVVNVTPTGDKGGPANTTSFSVSALRTTCLAALNSGQLFIGTEKACYPVDFNFNNTIFAEPTFINNLPMNVGIVNQFSFIDNNVGDYQFIDTDGLRSFNAVLNTQNEGRQSIFSAKIARAFESDDGLNYIKQSAATACATVFNNYSIFSLNTLYGQVLAIYDNTRGCWISFDRLTLDGTIKQLAVADQSENPTVYAITETSVYKLYKSSTFATARVVLKANTTGTMLRQKAQKLYAIFDKGSSAVIDSTAGIIVDNRDEVTTQQEVGGSNIVDVATYNFTNKGAQGWKISPTIEWSNSAILNLVQADYNVVTSPVDIKQSGRVVSDNS